MTTLDLIDGRIAEFDRLLAAANEERAAVGEREGLSLLLASLYALKAAKASRYACPVLGQAIAGGSAAGNGPGAGPARATLYFRRAWRGGAAASRPGVAPAISLLTSIPGATAS